MRWRVGRSVGRTLYIQIGEEGSKSDILIGMMDTPELAQNVVDAVNKEFDRLEGERGSRNDPR